MDNVLLKRRQFLTHAGTWAFGLAFARPALARSAQNYGVLPNNREDQSRAFQKMLEHASRQRADLFLAAGTYVIGGIELPEYVKLTGDGNNTLIVNTGPGPLIRAQGASTISIRHILLDGVNLSNGDEQAALLDLRQTDQVELSRLTARHARDDAVRLEQCSGSVTHCHLSEAGRMGLFAVDSKALEISGNTVEDCADGGIIVHRYSQGYDGARITGNIVRRIDASRGGTGQWGNGINIYKTDNVEITNNMIEDCAFSAIRANTARDFKISENNCLRSGETAIYAEFAFRNAEITNNTIRGAANGISAVNANEGGGGAVITGNTLEGINTPGPYHPAKGFFGHGISAEADTLIARNTITNTAGYGIILGWGPYLKNVEAIANTIKNARIGIGVSKAQGAGAVEIKGNSINAREGAIRAHEWHKIDPIDLALNTDSAPSHVTLEGNLVKP